MKNLKSLTLGILIGATATLSVTALAEVLANPNPYPVKVNGKEVAIEGYNINYSTYFKLRDISAIVGGFDVDFKDGAVTIDTAPPAPAPTPTPTPVANKDLAPLPDVPTETIDGVEYVNTFDIERMLDDIGLGQYIFSSTDFFDGSDYSKPSLLKDIPHHPTSNTLVSYDYYTSSIIPIINSLR